MPTLYTTTRMEYGHARRYLAQDAIGLAVKALTGKATLSPAHEEALRVLGVEVA